MKKLFLILITTCSVVFCRAQTNTFPSTGNVGIGTATPTALLEVIGDAKINGINIGRGTGSQLTNTAFGEDALGNNLFGGNNVAIGYKTLFGNVFGVSNIAIGATALYANSSGDLNVAIGYSSLRFNTEGFNNVAIGDNTLYQNTTGSVNTAIGSFALNNNITGDYNTATGNSALSSNSTGYENTATGNHALLYSTIGIMNTATGSYALVNNTSGNKNTASGAYTLINNTTGNYNTSMGYMALFRNVTGYGNSAFGSGANVLTGSLNNATALGANAIVDASNKVRIGNTSVTSIGGQVGWTNFSDGRIKRNIKENVPGLRFINLLKPVTYNYDLAKEYALLGKTDSSEYAEKNDIEKISFTGFVAQEVDAAAKKINYDFSGVDKTGKIMGLRYSEFVVPLVKAVQELDENQKAEVKIKNEEIAQLKSEIGNLKSKIDELRKVISNQVSATGNQLSGASNNQEVTLNPPLEGRAALGQNIPNPFKGATTINCFLPVNNGNAYINFYSQSGSLLKRVKIMNEGKNTITLNANELANGTYKYALVIDGREIESKMMILQR